MKKVLLAMIFCSIALMLCSQTPGIFLGMSNKEVRMIIRTTDLKQITTTDTLITGYNWQEDYAVSYHFKKHFNGKYYCHKVELITNNLKGEELIGSHRQDWEPISDKIWLYHNRYYQSAVLVTLEYLENSDMLFSYNIFAGL